MQPPATEENAYEASDLVAEKDNAIYGVPKMNNHRISDLLRVHQYGIDVMNQITVDDHRK
jgi:hypothetical protein